MESEVIQMTADLLSPGVPVFGSLTRGGTESIMLAIYDYKQYYSNRTRPNMYLVLYSESLRTQHMQPLIRDASTLTLNSGRLD